MLFPHPIEQRLIDHMDIEPIQAKIDTMSTALYDLIGVDKPNPFTDIYHQLRGLLEEVTQKTILSGKAFDQMLPSYQLPK